MVEPTTSCVFLVSTSQTNQAYLFALLQVKLKDIILYRQVLLFFFIFFYHTLMCNA